MTLQIAFVLLVVVLTMIGLVFEIARPHLIVLMALCVFLFTGTLSVDEALAGFSNDGTLTVALLFIIAGSIEKSGLADRWFRRLAGVSFSGRWTLLKILLPVTGLSAFLNNTPIVAAVTPVLRKWCAHQNVSPSKFLIPLSYATVLGGTITLMGTSTNLVVQGLMIDQNMEGFNFFQLAVVGIPISLVGLIYLITIGYRLLPNHHVIFPNDYDTTAPMDILSTMPFRRIRDALAIVTLILMIILAAAGVLSMFPAMMLTVIILFIIGSMTPREALRAIRFDVLLLIAASIGIGTAFEKSGAAAWIAGQLLTLGEANDVLVMVALVYLMTNILTEMLSNNASAVIMFPIGLEMANRLHADPMAFIVALTIAASAGFASPIGYQTHLIVYGPGGYHFKDYLKVGIPLDFIVMITTLFMIKIIWIS